MTPTIALVTLVGACSGLALRAAPEPPEPAESRPSPAKAGPHARVELICDAAAAAPGTTVNLGLRFTIDDGWHLYWDGQNDSGFPPSVDWKLPPKSAVGPIRWPVPTRHVGAGDILDHIYERSVTLTMPFTLPDADGESRAVTISGAVDWLVCKDVCIPESQPVSLAIPLLAPGSPPTPSKTAPAFVAANKSLPQPWPPTGLETRWEGEFLVIAAAEAESIAFFPAKDAPVADDLAKKGLAAGRTLRLRFHDLPTAAAAAPDRAHEPPRLRGVAVVRRRAETRGYELDIPYPKPESVQPKDGQSK